MRKKQEIRKGRKALFESKHQAFPTIFFLLLLLFISSSIHYIALRGLFQSLSINLFSPHFDWKKLISDAFDADYCVRGNCVCVRNKIGSECIRNAQKMHNDYEQVGMWYYQLLLRVIILIAQQSLHPSLYAHPRSLYHINLAHHRNSSDVFFSFPFFTALKRFFVRF